MFLSCDEASQIWQNSDSVQRSARTAKYLSQARIKGVLAFESIFESTSLLKRPHSSFWWGLSCGNLFWNFETANTKFWDPN